MHELSGHPAEPWAAPVLYADEQLLVLEKPAGLLCVPGRGADKQDCLSARVQRLYPDALVVHRLDMATSGICLMARGPAMQAILSRAFAERQVEKRYVAVVQGGPVPDHSGTEGWSEIDLPIAADWPRRPLRIIDHERGKPSRTRWRVAAAPGTCESADHSRLELEPVTGRTHQLRVHLAAIGHPILGDTLYAPPEVQKRSTRLLLHASELQLDHPLTGRRLTFTSAAPFDTLELAPPAGL